mgnify:CR=1 FL=1
MRETVLLAQPEELEAVAVAGAVVEKSQSVGRAPWITLKMVREVARPLRVEEGPT